MVTILRLFWEVKVKVQYYYLVCELEAASWLLYFGLCSEEYAQKVEDEYNKYYDENCYDE